MAAFAASVSGNDVILEWITATEINNLGFEVERKSLNSAYEMVGYVSGAGSITEQRYYTFIDSKISNGIYTY